MTTDAQREAREKWIQALESGEYGQTTRQLAWLDSSGVATFCCLGVACDISRENTSGWVGPDGRFGQLGFPTSVDRFTTIGVERAVLPYEVQVELGVVVDTPVVYAPEFLDHPANLNDLDERMSESGWFGLAELNDEYGADFSTIAGILRRQADDWDGRRASTKGGNDA